jgi:NAD(P)-dependent dehydrogenase (short-subunit alcohol dehydrogenase family)
LREQAVAAVPMDRTGTPDELAKAAVCLASDDSSYVIGIGLCVDGGAAQV